MDRKRSIIGFKKKVGLYDTFNRKVDCLKIDENTLNLDKGVLEDTFSRVGK